MTLPDPQPIRQEAERFEKFLAEDCEHDTDGHSACLECNLQRIEAAFLRQRQEAPRDAAVECLTHFDRYEPLTINAVCDWLRARATDAGEQKDKG